MSTQDSSALPSNALSGEVDLNARIVHLPNIESCVNYVEYGVPVGDFLEAVITNDLKRAVWHADGSNLWIIPAYVSWFYNYAPCASYGNKEKYMEWIHTGGWRGYLLRIKSKPEEMK